MKKTYVILAVAAMGLMSCEKLPNLTNFANISKDFTYKETIDVPKVEGLPDSLGPLPNGGMSAYLPPMAFATNSEKYISESGSAINLVKTVTLKQLGVTIVQPADKNFDFLDTIRVYASAPGLEEQLVAHKYGVPKGLQKLDLDVEPTINMKEYFLQDTMYVRFGGFFNAVPSTESKIELSTVYNMVANPLQKSE
ncbi:hypothetical protein [Polluticoccus soli]|uniref:hypothetical protein n=1 Tax=Polluticoccus soli TaxID=3034150 RepID=UPI0023E12C17|nr:hypothetical protein [Flavipsychrobacter sp. JY13-12]